MVRGKKTRINLVVLEVEVLMRTHGFKYKNIDVNVYVFMYTFK